MIKIGISGHRFLAELGKISVAIEQVLKHIELYFPNQQLTVLSQLAEGADRLVVHHVLRRAGAKLIAVLPLPQADYEADFETVESKSEFHKLLSQAVEVVVMSTMTTRNEGYESAGKYVLENCDILLTIWDGQCAQGQGGTGEMVSIARKHKLPIVWVHSGNRKLSTNEPTTINKEPGKISYENFLNYL